MVLGLKDNGRPGSGIDYKNIPIVDAEDWEDGLINTVKNKDNKVVVNVPLTKKRYRNPQDLLTEYQQRGRKDAQVIKTTGDLLNPLGIVTKKEEPVDKVEKDENGEVYKRPPITFKVE